MSPRQGDRRRREKEKKRELNENENEQSLKPVIQSVRQIQTIAESALAELSLQRPSDYWRCCEPSSPKQFRGKGEQTKKKQASGLCEEKEKDILIEI